ncbi:Glycerol-3-phosphate dehydrogenase [NAD(P)+] [hydrothermal vent metagenome]|uniref:Glycerol-3-phosphate dehydrogenase [NAD(P)+] n=1 Tax=hydrothermal vent metagenome TaxID=652676 RepID=A0A3B1AGP2_9ZZZZ
MADLSAIPVTVLGAGSWGTALAIQLARGGRPATLWGHDPRHMASLQMERVNTRYLPGVLLPDSLQLSDDLAGAVQGVRDILVVVPSHAFRGVLNAMQPHLRSDIRVMWATKGLESGSGKLLHRVVEEVLDEAQTMAVVSGPTFAREVAVGLPTALTVASKDADYARFVAERLRSDTFRAYTSPDVAGVEVGGAVKNVLAIAAGICDGLGFGANARSALVTRGLAEVMRLGNALGGQHETFMGLAGLGDLVLTCTDDQSRNRRLGLALGRGNTLEAALADIDQVVEGVQTAREVHDLALSQGVEMPITEQVHAVLYEARAPKEAVHALLTREQKAEGG